MATVMAGAGRSGIVSHLSPPVRPFSFWNNSPLWHCFLSDAATTRDDAGGPLFRPTPTSRGEGRDGFQSLPLTRHAVQLPVARYCGGLASTLP